MAAVARLQIVPVVGDDELVRDIRVDLDAADRVEGEAGSSYRWRAADGFTELASRLWTQRQIAAACGVSQTLVSVSVRCVREYPLGTQARPTFQTVFRRMQGEASAAAATFRTPTASFPIGDVDGYIEAGLAHFSIEEIRLALVKEAIALERRDADLARVR